MITTYAQLKIVKNDLSKHYRLGNDIDASPSRYEGGSNCVGYTGSNGNAATCTGFTPIANGYRNSFTGSFDGAGHKITSLYIKRPSTENVGLFAFISRGSKIKNIGVTDAYVVGRDNVGGLIGLAYGSVTEKNYFVDGYGTNGIGTGACSVSVCVSQTAVGIAALSSTMGWTTGAMGNWDFGTTSQLPAVLYS